MKIFAFLLLSFMAAQASALGLDVSVYHCTDKSGNELMMRYEWKYSPYVPKLMTFNDEVVPDFNTLETQAGLNIYGWDSGEYHLTAAGDDITFTVDTTSYKLVCDRNWIFDLFTW